MRNFFIIASLIFFAFISACAPDRSFNPTPPPTSSPTLASTLAPTLADTATPTNTPLPTPTPTLTPVPNGPCDNPLVPLRAGDQWTYQVTSSTGESTISLTTLGMQNGANTLAQVAYSDRKKNYTVQYPVLCQAGAIVDYPLFVMNMLFSDFLDKYVSASHVSGDYAPAYQSLIQNNWVLNWKARYLTREGITLGNPWGMADLVIPANTQMDLSFVLSGLRESVTVPAGTFPQALKSTQTLSMTVPGTILLIGIGEWYEPYIGLVRAQINAILEGKLTIPIQSTLELVTFTPGK